MSRVALALPIEAEDRIADDLLDHGHEIAGRCSSADELAATLVSGGSEFALVAATPRYLNSRLMGEADAAGIRVIALTASDSDRRHARGLDLHETVGIDAPWAELEAMLFAGASVADSASKPVDRRGEVIAVWGPAGSPGRTSIAIGVAAELAAAGFTVALADVDTHSGSVAPTLGLLDEAPGFAAACRLAGAGALTRIELERIGQRYVSSHGSFWVLTGIGRPSRWPELSAERVVTTLAACRQWVDYTVVDTGASLENDEEISSDIFAPRRNAATISALRDADRIIAVGTADPVGLSRFLRAHVDLVETLVTDQVIVVMNRVRASAIGLGAAAQVRQTLQRFGGINDAVLVPHDQAGMDGAVLAGITLLDGSARSPARAVVAQLVRERLLPPEPAPTPRRPFARSRFTRRRLAAATD